VTTGKPFHALGLGAVLAVTGFAVHAQGYSLVGTWRGAVMGMAFELVVQPNGAYSEIERSATIMTMQQGEVRALGPGLIAFVVEDWAPKTMPVYHATGTVGGHYTQQPTTKPPGGTWRIRFNGPNSVTMQDARLGGMVTFQRVG
jgi:hypothetical protein